MGTSHPASLALLAEGKDNNLNLLRMTAALVVLATHSFAVAIGTNEAEPFQNVLGMTLGTIAVDAFFLVSGFLVFGSLWRSQSVVDYAWARVLRIYPALLLMLLLVVFVVGPLLTTTSLYQYLTSPQTY